MKKIKVGTVIGILAMAGLLLPMADGCGHKHAKVKRAQSPAGQSAFAQVQNL